MDLAQLRSIFLFAAAFLNLVFTFLIWSKGKTKQAFYLGWLAFFPQSTVLAGGRYSFLKAISYFGPGPLG